MRVSADHAKCIGAGQCALFAPEIFQQDEETGLVIVAKTELGANDGEAAEAAVLACPSRAIELLRSG